MLAARGTQTPKVGDSSAFAALPAVPEEGGKPVPHTQHPHHHFPTAKLPLTAASPNPQCCRQRSAATCCGQGGTATPRPGTRTLCPLPHSTVHRILKLMKLGTKGNAGKSPEIQLLCCAQCLATSSSLEGFFLLKALPLFTLKAELML